VHAIEEIHETVGNQRKSSKRQHRLLTFVVHHGDSTQNRGMASVLSGKAVAACDLDLTSWQDMAEVDFDLNYFPAVKRKMNRNVHPFLQKDLLMERMRWDPIRSDEVLFC
jgi:hypothetical protein